ncbi:hypothetical protein PFICI_10533 [Pestalotiopsis fici W106-1]|uniref:Heterokaryon incompatibility domain-containing protein n=1 Tax=Pestalotiopsis fici (strain W106-1 / CGMCC3.15140) TaxID=1229662 RepID=W3X008_PESFW|nr:uncharacterized protein PFICI_10533 [Pestalotiopsis fici W106-1]ETS78471.1 hypothetical protein PFICI_10533 [Pestalotiopsis fici W106-1]
MSNWLACCLQDQASCYACPSSRISLDKTTYYLQYVLMDWHDSSCRRLDLADFGDGMCCMRCGSIRPTHPILPPIHKSEIRLLRLLPGVFDDGVECEIVKAELCLLPEYEAISYTWADETGDASHCQTISISGKPFLVTKNCEMALKRVRMRYYTRVIWIDAICIDQDDIQERGHQVGIMPQIYSQAKGVLMYIGEQSSSSGDMGPGTAGFLSKDLKSVDTICWPALLSTRYFTRLWILQEVALARRATLMWGGFSAAWSSILEKMDFLITEKLPPVFHRFDYRTFSGPDQILNLLLVAQSCNASDPRDKIFALLGLLPSRRIGDIEADYSIEAREIYIRVAVYLASNIDWLQILFHAGTEAHEGGQVPGLPSWVPDWSAPVAQKVHSYTIRSRIQAGIAPLIDVLPMTFAYNESEKSLNVRLLRTPHRAHEWHAWTEELSVPEDPCLWFPLVTRTSLFESVSDIRSDFCREYSIEDSESNDRELCLTSLKFGLKKINGSRYTLTGIPEQYTFLNEHQGVPITSAVQFLTMTLSFKNLKTILRLARDTLHTPTSYWSTNWDNVVEVVHLVEELASLFEPLQDQRLEQLWMTKFMAGELIALDKTTFFKDDSDTIAPDDTQELMKRLNDALWCMMIRAHNT